MRNFRIIFSEFYEEDNSYEELDKARNIIFDAVEDLNLGNKLNQIKIQYPCRGRNELFRDKGLPWDHPKVTMEIFPRDLDQNHIYHELGHEADRHDSEFNYDHEVFLNCSLYGGNNSNALNLSWNISLDKRLNERELPGISKEERSEEYKRLRVGEDEWFRELWKDPPRDFESVLELAEVFEDECPDNNLLSS